MTWTLDLTTGELSDPNGDVVTVIDGPPFNLPTDVQEWGEAQFREAKMSELTTDKIADFAQLWMGDIETVRK